MIDIHTHVLYGIDDGSQTLENSIEMLRTAEQIGFRGVVLTPHYMSYTNFVSKIDENKKRMKCLIKALRAENIQVQLFLGNELYYEPDMIDRVDKREFTTLNKSNYFLVETMRHDSSVEHLQDFLYRLQAKGYSTILAHPERYDFVREDPNILLDFMDKGTYIQTNALSLTGFYGSGSKETAEIMLEHDMVQFLASDAHRVKSYELMEKALSKAEALIGKKKLGRIMNYNPAMVLSNKDKIHCTPIEYNPKKKHHFFSDIKREKGKQLGEVGI